ncbi:MAG: adenylyltransferase/cytidyltransferase family protein [Salibacteraceae bacterium]
MNHLEKIQKKIYSKVELMEQISVWKENGDSVVFTNGCFDLIHLGHISYLSQAADLGNKFIVGVNSDSSVKRLGKSPTRPLKDEDSRALIIASLAFVDAVIVFVEDTPFELIESLVPNVLVKGGDYDPEETNPQSKKYIVGSDIVKDNGGKVSTLDFVPGYSTTSIEQKIKGEKN